MPIWILLFNTTRTTEHWSAMRYLYSMSYRCLDYLFLEGMKGSPRQLYIPQQSLKQQTDNENKAPLKYRQPSKERVSFYRDFKFTESFH